VAPRDLGVEAMSLLGKELGTNEKWKDRTLRFPHKPLDVT